MLHKTCSENEDAESIDEERAAYEHSDGDDSLSDSDKEEEVAASELDEEGEEDDKGVEDSEEDEEDSGAPNTASQMANDLSGGSQSGDTKQTSDLSQAVPAADAPQNEPVYFFSPKAGPNPTTDVLIPSDRIALHPTLKPRIVTESDLTSMLCWKNQMDTFKKDFESGTMACSNVMGVEFKEAEDKAFFVLGIVVHNKRNYFVPVGNQTAAMLVDPTRRFLEADQARRVDPNQCHFDKAKKKYYVDRTKMVRKILESIKAEPDVWKAVESSKKSRSASRPKAKQREDPDAVPEEAETRVESAVEETKKDSAAKKTREPEKKKEDKKERSKPKAGGSRRVDATTSEPSSKVMKQSTLVPMQQQQEAQEDDNMLPAVVPKATVQPSAVGPEAAAAGKRKLAPVSESEPLRAESRSKKSKCEAQEEKITISSPFDWCVDVPEAMKDLECRAEWTEGQQGAVKVTFTRTCLFDIPEGFEVDRNGSFVVGQGASKPLKIQVRKVAQ